MRRATIDLLGALLAAGLAALPAAAAEPQASAPPAEQPQPAANPAAPAPAGDESGKNHLNGPITVSADHAEWQRGGTMVYTGHVVLETGDFKIFGDRLELQQDAGGQVQARVDGKPAHCEQVAAGPDNPPLSADAKVMRYDSRTALLTLSGGDVRLQRGTDTLTGDSLSYNLDQRRIVATGGKQGQVRMVIHPPPREETPTPAPTPAAGSEEPR